MKKPFLGLPRNVLSMGVVSFLNDLSSDMIYPFIPTFLTSVLGAPVAFVGLVEGIADATAGIMKIISGRLSDKWGFRKPFIVIGYSLSALAKPILAFATIPAHVLGVRFVDRIGKGTRDAPRDALIALSASKENTGRAFGFHRSADTLGAALGPVIAFLVLPILDNDLRALFLLSFVASALAAFIVFIGVREVRTSEVRSAVPFRLRELGVPFYIFICAATLLALGRASEAFLLLRAQEVGVILMYLPIIYFSYNMVFALASTPAGILSDKIGHRNTYMLGMIVFSLSYFLFAQKLTLVSVWFLFGLYGISSALTEGVGKAVVADLVPEHMRATAFGTYNALIGIAALPAGIIFGSLWDMYGSGAAFGYGASLGVVALLAFALFRGFMFGKRMVV